MKFLKITLVLVIILFVFSYFYLSKRSILEDPVKNVLQEDPNVIVEFYKENCPYCDYLRPIFQRVIDESADDITFMTMEVTSNAQYFKETYGFSSVPTVVYFKDGKSVKQHGTEDKTIKAEDIKKNIKDIYYP